MPRLPVPPCSQAPLGSSCCCCKRCNIGGCDLRILDCGCCFHSRCCPVTERKPLAQCPICGNLAKAMRIMPMAFDEIDQAQREAANTALTDKRGKKRKNATITRLNAVASEDGDSSSDLRSGRWTDEETNYCDKLIVLFERGQLPVPDGIKLIDFLSNMLKSKQSRLTKKIKNARMSARLYKCETGYIESDVEAIEFSRSETEFFASIKCNMERSEIKFHMQKEWREHFSSYCVRIGQKVDADAWMSSVEELDRRVSQQIEAARMAKRSIMMGKALETDVRMNNVGVFINNSISSSAPLDCQVARETVSSRNDDERSGSPESSNLSLSLNRKSKVMKKSDGVGFFSSCLIRRMIQYVVRNGMPFEHMDIWVPSYAEGGASLQANNLSQAYNQEKKCRLFFAGFGTADSIVPAEGGCAIPMSSKDVFDLLSFGEYSEKFSFDVGCGLPGRVYSSGVSSWEQGIQNAPQAQFERIGGARQWGIETVIGIPIPSPNVGRIVAVFYSKFDRPQNLELVNRISVELSKFLPTPKWQLVVDVGASTVPAPDNLEDSQRQSDLLHLIDVQMPADKNSPFAAFLPGFTSIQLLLRKESKSEDEQNVIKKILELYLSYKQSARTDPEVAAMIARDFMCLTRHGCQQQVQEEHSTTQLNCFAVTNCAGTRVCPSDGTLLHGQNVVLSGNTEAGTIDCSKSLTSGSAIGQMSPRGEFKQSLSFNPTGINCSIGGTGHFGIPSAGNFDFVLDFR